MKIGFKNFRQFKNFEPIETKGITFLVGQNNSGKSTYIKALLLLDDYFKGNIDDFQFSADTLNDSNINTFERALIKNHSKKEIEFLVEMNIEIPVNFLNVLTENGFVRKDEAIKHRILFRIILRTDDKPSIVDKLIIELPDACFKIELDFEASAIRFKKGKNKLANIYYDDEIDYYRLKEKYEEQIKLNAGKEKTSWVKNAEETLNKYEEKFARVKVKYYQKSEFDIEEKPISTLSSFKSLRNDLIKIIKKLQHEKNTENAQEIFIKELGEYYLDFDNCPYKYTELNKTDIEYFEFCLKTITIFLNSISDKNYLGLQVLKPSIFYPIIDKKNQIAQTIHQFNQQKIKQDTTVYPFVIRWLKEFKICDDFEFKLYENESYTINVIRDNGLIPLADLGLGSIHIFLLILKISCKAQSNYNKPNQRLRYTDNPKKLTMIIEEPETNLHPALQSKLADFFYKVNKEYDIQFIIETHSEYLIRRSQVIVAQNKLVKENNPFCVQYFTGDTEKPYYQLEYLEDGWLTKGFGAGFFDEASNNLLELVKLKKVNQN